MQPVFSYLQIQYLLNSVGIFYNCLRFKMWDGNQTGPTIFLITVVILESHIRSLFGVY